MNAQSEELLRQLDASRAALRDAVEGIPASLRATRPDPDRWSAVEVMEHLVLVERRVTKLILSEIDKARAADGASDNDEVPRDVDMTKVRDRNNRIVNPPSSQPTGAMEIAEAWRQLEESRADLRGALAAGEDLPHPGFVAHHMVLGPLSFRQWFSFIAVHEARHADQIKEAGAILASASEA